MNKHQALAIQALSNMRGNDTARARRAFRHFSDEKMQQEYGTSGKTYAQVLADHEAYDARVDAAIAWVKEQA